MVSGPNLPEVEREVFAQPPLKVMLGQVRFPPVLRIADIGALAPFQESVRDRFPSFAEERQVSLVLGPDGPQEPTTRRAFRFAADDRAWSMLLTPDAVTVEADVTARYTSYDEFIDSFRFAWTAVVEHFAPARITRQGLRYVDHIEGDMSAADWQRYINRELLGPLTGTLDQGVVQCVAEMRIRREDGDVVFKHGILPAGPANAKGYLLDFDYFVEREESADLDEIAARFDNYHAFLYRFFRWCVTEEALHRFRGETT